jgi:hypothetical protein
MLDDYVHLRLGDLISLAFCTRTGETLTHDRWTIRLDDGRVVVTPDLFGGEEIPFAIQAREIEDVSYPSNEALRAAVRSARLVTLEGRAAARRS